MGRSNVFVVYGYLVGTAPVGEAPIKGFGKSNRAALASAVKAAKEAEYTNGPVPLMFYFVRSNGDRVLAPQPLAAVSDRVFDVEGGL